MRTAERLMVAARVSVDAGTCANGKVGRAIERNRVGTRRPGYCVGFYVGIECKLHVGSTPSSADLENGFVLLRRCVRPGREPSPCGYAVHAGVRGCIRRRGGPYGRGCWRRPR